MQEYGLYANILVYLNLCLKEISCTLQSGLVPVFPLFLYVRMFTDFSLQTPYGPSSFLPFINSSSLLQVYLSPAISVYEEARFPFKE